MINWKHAVMCANTSNAVYADEPLCFEMVEQYCKTKKSFKFFKNQNAEACAFVHDKDNIVICFRGTQPAQLSDVAADLKTWQVDAETEGEVHAGFKGELDKLYDHILAYAKMKQSEGKNILVTGHSLGAAMATIAASRLHAYGKDVTLYTFGSPRVGDHTWSKQFDNIPTYRFVNNNDIVCKVPPYGFFTHIGELKYINYYGNIRNVTWWQRFKDQLRGRWRALMKFQLFDGAFDHSMTLYADKVKRHLPE